MNKESFNNDIKEWLLATNFPLINIRRFPHSKWYEDDFLDAVKTIMGLIILFSFLHPFVSTVKAITVEKENQLKVCDIKIYFDYNVSSFSVSISCRCQNNEITLLKVSHSLKTIALSLSVRDFR